MCVSSHHPTIEGKVLLLGPAIDKRRIINDAIEWDTANWSVALDFWQQQTSLRLSDCCALELGARNGGLSMWLALNGCHVTCSDLHGPTEMARKLHHRYEVENMVEYATVDATNMTYRDHFDLIVFKSVLGSVGWNASTDSNPIRDAISSIHRALKPGGELWFAENLIATRMHQLCRRCFVPWGSKWHYVSVPEMKDLLAPFSRVEYITAGFLGAFGLSEFQRRVLGFFDNTIFTHALPEEWNYIMIGSATK